jgi:hypothetical protein
VPEGPRSKPSTWNAPRPPRARRRDGKRLTSLAQHYDLSTAAMWATLELLPQASEMVKEVRFHGDDVVFVIEM